MKKTTLIASAAFLLIAASANAQTEPTPAQAPKTEASQSKDKYNNWTPETYKLQPMPEALTTEKVFPAIGKYELTGKDGAASTVTVTLDETSKGIVWVDGLPEGRFKAILRKSPAIYKIPAQKLGEEENAKKLAEGVLIYDRDANTLSVCIGCTYNAEDPAIAFTPDAVAAEEKAAEEAAKPAKTAKTKAAKKPAVAKVEKIKAVRYTGSKVIETTAAVPVQQ